MGEDVCEHFAEGIFVGDPLAGAVLSRDIQALLVEPAEQFFVGFSRFAGESSAFFNSESGPEIEPGRVFAVEPLVVLLFGDQEMGKYLPTAIGAGAFNRDEDPAIGPVVVDEEVAKVGYGFHKRLEFKRKLEL